MRIPKKNDAPRLQFFYSQYDSRYVGCHWLRLAPFLCTNLIGQGPELLTTPAQRSIKKLSPIFRPVTFLVAFGVVSVAPRTGWCVTVAY